MKALSGLLLLIGVFIVQLVFPIVSHAQEVSRTCGYKKSYVSHGQSSRTTDNNELISIPVVVHVIYSTTQQNISIEQIASQLRVLNEDFTRGNSDTVNTLSVFKLLAGNAKIKFFLASQDALGNPTNGITRTATLHGPFANNDVHFTDQGGKSAWPTNRYLNIWVCDLADGVFGFSSPLGSDPALEGIVVDFNFFGTTIPGSAPFDKGRTATHEIGHWMGLKHLWGDQGGCIDDDGVLDTPQQSGPTSGCNLTKISCGALNMVQNFMDNSDDRCMNLFTKGQVTLMRENLFANGQGIFQTEVVTGVSDQSLADIKIFKLTNSQYQIKSEHSFELMNVYNLSGQSINWAFEKNTSTEGILNISGAYGIFILAFKSGNDQKAIKFVSY